MTATTMNPAIIGAERVKAASRQPGLLARMWAAFVESRMRQAERQIMLHRHLLPAQFEFAGERVARSEKDLPFVK